MASPAKKSKMELVPEISAKYGRINPSKNFLFEPMLNYILKNASQKAYYKLIQMSKYFLANQPPQIIMLDDSYYNQHHELDPDKVSEIAGNRLWIKTENFTWRHLIVPVNDFLQRCFRVDIKWLNLWQQALTYDELKLLMERGNMTILDLNLSEITHSNGEEVALEDILKMAPLLKYLCYFPNESFTLNSQKIAGLPNFYNLECIELLGFDEDLCCCALRSLLKKAPKVTSGRFSIYYNVSPEHLRKFQIALLKEINPTIKVNCVEQTICFGKYYDDL